MSTDEQPCRPVPDTGQVPDPIVAAADLLFEHRHTLPAGVLRSIADIWVCASAAKYGEPYERFWEDDPFAGHDTDECEAGNATTPSGVLLGTEDRYSAGGVLGTGWIPVPIAEAFEMHERIWGRDGRTFMWNGTACVEIDDPDNPWATQLTEESPADPPEN